MSNSDREVYVRSQRGSDVPIGYVKTETCDHCGTFYRAFAYRDAIEMFGLGEYSLGGTYDVKSDAEDAIREEHEALGPFDDEFDADEATFDEYFLNG
jgi:hypothetical protein